jgi:iron complex transport system substrate-binding protein
VFSKILFALVLLCTASGCIRHQDEQGKTDRNFDTGINYYPEKTEVSYSKGFSVIYGNYWKLLTLHQPGNEKTFLLLQRGAPLPEEYKNDESLDVIRIPVERCASVSTTHLPMLEAIECLHTLKGFSAMEYLYNNEIKQELQKAGTISTGTGGTVEEELLLSSQAEVNFSYAFENEGAGKKVGNITDIPVAEYLETHPLAAAEWIKFYALFFNKEQQANNLFKNIEQEYLNTLKLVKSMPASNKKVFTGVAWKNTWPVPAGDSYTARLIEDAGGIYVYASTENKGNITLDVEQVIHDCFEADIWLVVTYFNDNRSMDNFSKMDTRYTRFSAFKKGAVYACDLTEKDYFGKAILEPHLLLKDLYCAIYGCTDYEPAYYSVLK